MNNQLLNGVESYLMLGQNTGINSYLTNPYLLGTYLSAPYLSNSSLAGAGMAGVFQSGVRFGQAMEKAMEKNPERAEELQNILKEAFGTQSETKAASGRGSAQAKNGTWSSVAAVYEPSWEIDRVSGTLENYLAGRRSARAQERQAAKSR